MPVTLRMMLETVVTKRKSESDNIHQRMCQRRLHLYVFENVLSAVIYDL